MSDLRDRNGEILDTDDDGESILDLLDQASAEGTIVVIGPEGMTKAGIIHSLEHREAHKIVYLIDVPHTVPGDASALN